MAAVPRIPILRYGAIAPAPPDADPAQWPLTTPEAFERQMGWLSECGYQALAMRDLEPYLRGEKTGKVVGLTLDAAVAVAEHALPVLLRHGFTSTCFAISGRLGTTWTDERGGVPVPLMDARQLRAWVAAGQEVGAYSRHHVDLRTLDDWSAWTEIAGCKDDLEQLTEAPVRHYCYPYGQVAPVLAAMVRAAGYASATTVLPPRVMPRSDAGKDLFALPGVSVSATPQPAAVWLRVTLGIEAGDPQTRSALVPPPGRGGDAPGPGTK